MTPDLSVLRQPELMDGSRKFLGETKPCIWELELSTASANAAVSFNMRILGVLPHNFFWICRLNLGTLMYLFSAVVQFCKGRYTNTSLWLWLIVIVIWKHYSLFWRGRLGTWGASCTCLMLELYTSASCFNRGRQVLHAPIPRLVRLHYSRVHAAHALSGL